MTIYFVYRGQWENFESKFEIIDKSEQNDKF